MTPADDNFLAMDDFVIENWIYSWDVLRELREYSRRMAIANNVNG